MIPTDRRGFFNVFDETSGMPVEFTAVMELVEIEGWDMRNVDFIDLDSIISIEVAGQTIEFR